MEGSDRALHGAATGAEMGPRAPAVERHDSVLGRWEIVRWSPPDLVGLVQEIWYFEGVLAHRRERHYPTGCLDIAVHLGPRYGRVEGDFVNPFPTVSVSGLHLAPDVIEAPGERSAVLGIVLHPPGALRLLAIPLSELTGRDEDLGAVLPARWSHTLTECLGEAASGVDRVRVAEGWVRRRLARDAALREGSRTVRSFPDPDVLRAADTLRRSGGRSTVQELAEAAGGSRSRFSTLFREQIGVPPKTYARVQRFRSALGELTGGRPERGLSEIALQAGYYDQAHFNRDFREFSGVTPSEYLARIRFPESPSTAEASP
jgi:AraC-like DNA-binding protein